MDIETLDRSLRQLSDSEIGYKNKTKKSMWEDLKPGEIPCIHLLDFPGAKRKGNRTFGVVLPELNMSINRNSRYDAVPTHTHKYIEISYVYSGNCPEVIRGKDLVLQQGQVLLLDTDVPHSVAELGEDDVMINILLDKEYLYKN